MSTAEMYIILQQNVYMFNARMKPRTFPINVSADFGGKL